MKSSFVRISKSVVIGSIYGTSSVLKAAKIISISFCSFNSSSRSSLFSLMIAIGSIKSVDPVADWSWTIPANWLLYSARTGRQ